MQMYGGANYQQAQPNPMAGGGGGHAGKQGFNNAQSGKVLVCPEPSRKVPKVSRKRVQERTTVRDEELFEWVGLGACCLLCGVSV